MVVSITFVTTQGYCHSCNYYKRHNRPYYIPLPQSIIIVVISWYRVNPGNLLILKHVKNSTSYNTSNMYECQRVPTCSGSLIACCVRYYRIQENMVLWQPPNSVLLVLASHTDNEAVVVSYRLLPLFSSVRSVKPFFSTSIKSKVSTK